MEEDGLNALGVCGPHSLAGATRQMQYELGQGDEFWVQNAGQPFPQVPRLQIPLLSIYHLATLDGWNRRGVQLLFL
jgi:hypothetical protein